jgi:hypothetical protein
MSFQQVTLESEQIRTADAAMFAYDRIVVHMVLVMTASLGSVRKLGRAENAKVFLIQIDLKAKEKSQC